MRRMRRALLALIAVVLIPAAARAQASTVIIVRHAEKAGETGDVDLSEAGHRRAEALRETLRHYAVQGVFVSEFKRTRQTAEPTATANGLTPTALPVRGGVPAQAAATVAAARALPAGSTALVVGHSNTVTKIIAAFGGPALPDLCDREYATLFLLELKEGAPAKLLRVSYGTPDPAGAAECPTPARMQ
jgi:broad specificity phosphatase PhoE